MVVERLEKAFQNRKSVIESLSQSGTDAYRFVSPSTDRIPGLVIECFGATGIFQFHQGKCELTIADLKIAARWCMDHLGLKQVYLKKFVSDRSTGSTPEELRAATPFVGEPCEPQIAIKENDHAFLIRPYDGFSVGLFLDQRNNRATVGKKKRGSVLNLFSYTCGFSVYCAKSGSTVTSVDISGKYLDWGKENFKANGLALEDHRFFVADARYFLRAAAKRQEQYDLIVVDPPSFSRGMKNEPFSVKRNLGELLTQCAEVLSDEGTIFVSTNFAQWSQLDLDKAIEQSIGKTTNRELPELPPDLGKEDASIICRWLERR